MRDDSQYVDFWKTSQKADYALVKEFAKIQREFPTEAEIAMWNLLKRYFKSYKFRRQHIIGDYIADFICLPESLVIEIDGGYHNALEQQLRDKERTDWLMTKGLQVVRFTNEEVLFNPKKVILKLRDLLT